MVRHACRMTVISLSYSSEYENHQPKVSKKAFLAEVYISSSDGFQVYIEINIEKQIEFQRG